jgi:predicted ATPase
MPVDSIVSLATRFRFSLRCACYIRSLESPTLWRDQRKVQQARELLAPVYGWFTEGFDSRDLKEAETLINELAS